MSGNDDASVRRIDNVVKESALAKGENYLSTISRTSADVWLSSGEIQKVSCILKDQHQSPLLKQMSVEAGFFLREIEMYRDVLPKMKSLMEAIGDRKEPIWPECFGYRLYDQIALEDLKNCGYVMADRRKQLDLEHTLFTLRQIAEFHAISCVLHERSQIPVDLFGKIFWARNLDQTKEEIDGMLFRLVEALEQWGYEWHEAKSRLEEAIPLIWSEVKQFFNSCNNGLTVLNHGDCWTNNFLFRYENSSPVSMKIVDFQLCHLGTPAHDLHWFFASSVPTRIRKQNFDEILNEYTRILAGNLIKYGYKGDLPTLEVIRGHYDRYKVLQLWYTVLTAPGVLAETKAAYDVEEIMREAKEAKDRGQKSQFNPYSNLADLPRSVIQEAILDAMANKLI
ncbi:transferase activity, transferring phosphorus-containing groups [Nesidiocoris tenuis]|nr:transferase activity, transferring phosphorus-containing groups [Nesidiocoris tenuis]